MMRDLAFRLAACSALAALAACSDAGSTASAPAIACNGHAELCDRPFDQVAFAGAHNAMSNAEDGWLLPNQIYGIPRQLVDGVRVLLIDTHEYQGKTWLCHDYCELGKIPLVDALASVRAFMDENPNEVLAFVIQDGISNEATEAAFVESGLVRYVYTHEPGSAWPTLRDMIARDERLLVMAEGSGPPPAWYHYAYDLSWDTPYTFAREEDFSCELNRGRRENDLFQINHWLSTPFSMPENGERVNRFDVLWARVDRCRNETGRIPNFVVVDYVHIGDLFAVVDRLNGF
ncbi:MAG TPA: hypothetical protein VFD92_20925 [Candidatus Binatia bacterium]|nr:hypothetical protein [Candidatus Binatia bacterium]